MIKLLVTLALFSPASTPPSTPPSGPVFCNNYGGANWQNTLCTGGGLPPGGVLCNTYGTPGLGGVFGRGGPGNGGWSNTVCG